jgi:hypothetical protein
MVLSYVMFVYALVAASGDELVFAGGLLGIALGLVPGVFAVAAFVSNNPKTLLSTLGATALWFVITAPIGLGSLPVGLVAGYGAGGVVAFRLGPNSTRGSRVVAVTICAVYTLVLQRVLPEAGLFAGAPLPFAAIALADHYRDRFADGTAAV